MGESQEPQEMINAHVVHQDHGVEVLNCGEGRHEWETEGVVVPYERRSRNKTNTAVRL